MTQVVPESRNLNEIQIAFVQNKDPSLISIIEDRSL